MYLELQVASGPQRKALRNGRYWIDLRNCLASSQTAYRSPRDSGSSRIVTYLAEPETGGLVGDGTGGQD